MSIGNSENIFNRSSDNNSHKWYITDTLFYDKNHICSGNYFIQNIDKRYLIINKNFDFAITAINKQFGNGSIIKFIVVKKLITDFISNS